MILEVFSQSTAGNPHLLTPDQSSILLDGFHDMTMRPPESFVTSDPKGTRQAIGLYSELADGINDGSWQRMRRYQQGGQARASIDLWFGMSPPGVAPSAREIITAVPDTGMEVTIATDGVEQHCVIDVLRGIAYYWIGHGDVVAPGTAADAFRLAATALSVYLQVPPRPVAQR